MSHPIPTLSIVEHVTACILSVLRDAPRADRRILWAVQCDGSDVENLRDTLPAILSDMGYVLCTSTDAVSNGHVDMRYVGPFGSDGTEDRIHGPFPFMVPNARYVGHSVPLPEHEAQVHAGDMYVSLPGDTFAGEPLRSGTLVGWDAECHTHYPMGPADPVLWRNLWAVGSLVSTTFGTAPYRVVEPVAPEDTTCAIVPVAQGMRGPVQRIPLGYVRPVLSPMSLTFAPTDDVELGESIRDLCADYDEYGVSLWDLSRTCGIDCTDAVRTMVASGELRLVRGSVSHGASLYGRSLTWSGYRGPRS